MKQDAALSEITSFLMILAVTILCAAVFSAAVLPDILRQEETKRSEEALFGFASLKNGMEALAFNEAAGITRKEEFPPPLFGTARLSVSYGDLVTHAGGRYYQAVITYEAEQRASEKLLLTLDEAGLKRNGRLLLPSAYRILLDPAETAEQMDIHGTSRIEYACRGSFTENGMVYYIFSLRLL